jgi:hypothetical protein
MLIGTNSVIREFLALGNPVFSFIKNTAKHVQIVIYYFSDYHNNDAAITKHLFKNNLDNVNQWFQADDVYIVDRGFWVI